MFWSIFRTILLAYVHKESQIIFFGPAFQVMHFLDRQKHLKNPKYIVVHCTHGHNRTGFMIVHYLMRSQVLSVAQVCNLTVS